MYAIIRHMKRTTIFMDEAMESDLKVLAKYRGMPIASLVREAISEYVRKARQNARPKLSFVGAFRSGHRNTAERHEALLWRDLAGHSESGPTMDEAAPRASRRRSPNRKQT